MPEAIIYCRASKDRTGAGLSVAGQEKDCRDFAAQQGLTVREVYADNDISADGRKARPDYRRMLADLAAHPGTVVVVWHTDRLHRHLAELEEYIALAEAHGIITRAVRAGDLDLATPSGRMVARMLGVVARHELEHMSERRKAGKARAAAAGRWKGGRRPFGYEADGVTIRAAEAAAIAQGSEDVLAGVSLHAVARAWNTAGLRPSGAPYGPLQHPWSAREVSRVLRRARNAGLMEHRGQVIGPAEWAAIVSEATWRAVCAVLENPARRTSPGPERRHLLSGIGRCGVCGRGLIVSVSGGRNRDARLVYRCRPAAGPGHVARDLRSLDDYIAELSIERLRRPDLSQAAQPPHGGNGSADLHARMIAARERLDQAAGLFAAHEIDARQLAAITGKLNAEIDDLGRRLGELGRRDALSAFYGVPDPAAVWEGLDLARKRAVIGALMTITVDRAPKGRTRGWERGRPYFDPDSIRIDWHR